MDGRKIAISVVIILSLLLVVWIGLEQFKIEKISPKTVVSKPIIIEPEIFDGDYEDLLRHESDHLGKIVKIAGCVSRTDAYSGLYQISMWDACSSFNAQKYHILSKYSERLLKGDLIQGYGTYYGICTESGIGDPYTCFTNVKLLGYDFETFPKNGVCAVNDKTAEKLGFCE